MPTRMVQHGQDDASLEPLELARGVRFPRDDEFRAGQEQERALVAQARLVTGFVSRDARSDSFSTYFEANVHASDIWQCFSDLVSALLPEVAAPLIQFKGEEPIYGPYVKRAEALAAFQPHAMFLQHEGYLGFGMMFQYQGRTEEVFVHNAKYLKVWTNQPEAARNVFMAHEVKEVPDLHFIDEYPMVTEALLNADGKIVHPEVLAAIEAAFRELTPVHAPEPVEPGYPDTSFKPLPPSGAA